MFFGFTTTTSTAGTFQLL